MHGNLKYTTMRPLIAWLGKRALNGTVTALFFVLAIFGIAYAAISYPSSAPLGETNGGKFMTYFTKMLVDANINSTDGTVKKASNSDNLWGYSASSYLRGESDPKIGSLAEGKWCRTVGWKVECASDSPSGGWVAMNYNANTWVPIGWCIGHNVGEFYNEMAILFVKKVWADFYAATVNGNNGLTQMPNIPAWKKITGSYSTPTTVTYASEDYYTRLNATAWTPLESGKVFSAYIRTWWSSGQEVYCTMELP